MTAPGAGHGRRIALVMGLLIVLLAPGAAPHATGEPAAPEFLAVRVDSVTPDVVTTSSEPIVTVVGTITNV